MTAAYGIRDAIADARKCAEREPGLAVFMVRDFPEIEAAGLRDLAWSMASGNVASSEAKWFLDILERFIETGSVALDSIIQDQIMREAIPKEAAK